MGRSISFQGIKKMRTSNPNDNQTWKTWAAVKCRRQTEFQRRRRHTIETVNKTSHLKSLQIFVECIPFIKIPTVCRLELKQGDSWEDLQGREYSRKFLIAYWSKVEHLFPYSLSFVSLEVGQKSTASSSSSKTDQFMVNSFSDRQESLIDLDTKRSGTSPQNDENQMLRNYLSFYFAHNTIIVFGRNVTRR